MVVHLTRCPVCGATNGYWPGEPPTNEPHSYRNRCSAHAITGRRIRSNSGKRAGEKSHYAPRRSASELCGAALVDETGSPLGYHPHD